MALQFSVAVRNGRLDAIETVVSTTPVLRIRTGAAPANCAAADTGTVLAEMTLPSDWLDAAAAGVKSKAGTWQDLAGNAAGDAGHWRIYDAAGTTCHLQGSCGASGSGADMELSNVSIAVGQAVTVTSFAITDGNA